MPKSCVDVRREGSEVRVRSASQFGNSIDSSISAKEENEVQSWVFTRLVANRLTKARRMNLPMSKARSSMFAVSRI